MKKMKKSIGFAMLIISLLATACGDDQNQSPDGLVGRIADPPFEKHNATTPTTSIQESVQLPDYICHPDSPPVFDVSAFADGKWKKVVDANNRDIGSITEEGIFIFYPEQCAYEL